MSMYRTFPKSVATATTLIALILIYPFALAIFNTINAGFDLEHLEGEVILSAYNVAHGFAPYADKMSTRLEPLYGPLYLWLTGLTANFYGGHPFTAGRVISLISYVASVIALAIFVRPSGSQRLACWSLFMILIGLTLTQFGRLGSWYFLARVDMLAVFFSFAAWATLRAAKDNSVLIGTAGALVAFAVAAKQSFLIQVPAMAVAAVTSHLGRQGSLKLRSLRWRTLFMMATQVTGPVVIMLGSALIFGGWSTIDQLFQVANKHGLEPRYIRKFWSEDLWRIAAPELILSLGTLTVMIRRRESEFWVFGSAFVASIMIAYSSRIHSGGFVNVVIPGIFMIDGLAARAIVELWNRAAARQYDRIPRSLALIYSIVLAALALSRPWGFREFRVVEGSERTTESLTEWTRHANILFTDVAQIHLNSRTFDPTRASHQAIWDGHRVERDHLPDFSATGDPASARAYQEDIVKERYDYIVANYVGDRICGDDRWYFLIPYALVCEHYDFFGMISYEDDAMFPLTGFKMRPNAVFASKSRRASLPMPPSSLKIEASENSEISRVYKQRCVQYGKIKERSASL